MKKIILLLLVSVVLLCCSPKDEEGKKAVVNILVPIVSVNLPNSFTEGETYNIKIVYSPPTRCHDFAGLEKDSEENEYYFAVMNSYSPNDASCEEEEGLTGETSFSFTPETNDFYIFNFWQGQNDQGESRFLTMEIPVEPDSSEHED